MDKTLYKSIHRVVGKSAWRRTSLVLQKNISEEGIPMLDNIDEIIASINTLRIHA
jgi:hypothetical protein